MYENKVESQPDKRKTASGNTSGIKAVLDQAMQSYERLPMLEIVFEKFIRQLATAFRNLTSETVEVEITEFSSLRFGTYFKTIHSPSTITVFKAIEWENFGLLVLDSNLVFSFVDILLGGKKNIVQNSKHDMARVLTSIEQGIAKQISEAVLNELSTAFEPVSPSTFAFERLENNPNFATICRLGDAIILLKLKIDIDGKADFIDLVIPYKTIEPIKDQLQQVFLGDKFGSDAAWEETMLNTIYNVDLPIEAVIINKPAALFEVVNLKIGDTIIMDQKHDEDVVVRSGNIALFKGHIGKVDDKVAVSLKTFIEE